MQRSFIALFGLLTLGCFPSSETSPAPVQSQPVQAVDASPDAAQTKVDDGLAPPKPATPAPAIKPVPDVKFLALTHSWKEGDSMTMGSVAFPFEVKVGSNVTVIPRNGLSSMSLAVVKLEKQVFEEIDETVWNVSFAPITRTDYLTAPVESDRRPETPFDAVIVYPEVASVQILSSDTLKKEEMPLGVYKHNIWAAFDFNGDSQADGLHTSFYCKCPEVVPGSDGCDACDCDYGCSESYVKRAGKWEVAGAVGPM